MADLFNKLNQKQIEAVKSTEGRIRVTAGAGTGKTRLLTHRYAYLVNELGISPSNILCVTFTNKAANEMKKRIASMVSEGNVNDFVCTIHGFCVSLLRKELFRIGYPKNFAIIDEEDSKDLAKQVLQEFKLDQTLITAKQFLQEIHLFKQKENYIGQYMLPNSTKDSTNQIERFLQLQSKNFALDFDDLILFTTYILEKYEDARNYWQDIINYIMVDEAQDFSARNWNIIEILSSKYNNLFIVGDPDQAIYEWRGASPELFINFIPDKDFVLDENYRSTPNILNVANSIIKNNKKRIEKNLITHNESGRIVLHYHGKNEIEESDWIANQIALLKESGFEYSDCAILYRASYLSRSVEQSLLKKQMPYSVWGGISFFERKEIKDALAYLKLVAYKDDISFKRIINVPSRKFGKTSLEKVIAIAEKENLNLFEALRIFSNTNDNKNIKSFIKLIDESTNIKDKVSISDLAYNLLDKSDYLKTIRTDSDDERLENLEELFNSMKYYEQVHKDDNFTIDSYLQDIALYTNADYNNDGTTIKLMTIHQAKGLEFPFVFVCGLTEGIFPNHKSLRERQEKALEEERRLMYVATTRAQKGLFLTESEGFNASTQTNKYPSRFITEISKDLIEVEGNISPDLFKGTKDFIDLINYESLTESIPFDSGDIIKHKVFGIGKIIQYNKSELSYKVLFDTGYKFIKPTFLQLINPVKTIDHLLSYDFQLTLIHNILDKNARTETIIQNPLLLINFQKKFRRRKKHISVFYGEGKIVDISTRQAYRGEHNFSKGVMLVDYNTNKVKYRWSQPFSTNRFNLGDFVISNDSQVYQIIDINFVSDFGKSYEYFRAWSIKENKEHFLINPEIKKVLLPMNDQQQYLVNEKDIWDLENIEYNGNNVFVWFKDNETSKEMKYNITDLIEYSFANYSIQSKKLK